MAAGDEVRPPPRGFHADHPVVDVQCLHQRALSVPLIKRSRLFAPCEHTAGVPTTPAGVPTRPLWTFALLLCDVLTFVLKGSEVVAFALLVAALTLVVPTTAHSERSMMVAMAMLSKLRLCFIVTIHLLKRVNTLNSTFTAYSFCILAAD
jgi:hypothetical protein